MRLAPLAALVAIACLASAVSADTSPYRGLETRAIKALSPQEVSDLEAGRGMSQALAAELNGFPGPRHVLDLAGPLGLTAGQSDAMQALFDAMKAEASAIGTTVIVREAALEAGFRTASLDADALTAAVMSIAEARGRLRAAHLRYHLATRDLLDAHQLALYGRLRGYGDRHPARHRH